MILVKNFKFLYLFDLRTFGLEKKNGEILYRKLAFLDNKNIDLKKLQTLLFSRGVNP